ncbi:chorismate mutase aro7 [Tieghemiomyces parasiticus]|uniref:chorismate mutase n=1 Tax=Tieghemiomyces parasiticus TaxID=78921 RepID=A0A9W8A634_9FUNG|nr:chorismate mutase aro7 [Tieghemiomyces parasiticus]
MRPTAANQLVGNPAKLQELPLSDLRNTLIRLEDTIIFGLIERAQFKRNDVIYQPGAFEFTEECPAASLGLSFFSYFLWEQEKLQAKVRRYQSPDEYPFFPGQLPDPILPPLNYPPTLHPNTVNINDRIMDVYLHSLIPQICASGDDRHHGASAVCDVDCLQNLSKRIHYGKFIAESKFRDPRYHATYVELIRKRDTDGIMKLLTNSAVEQKLLRRLRRKAVIYGQDLDEEEGENGAPAVASQNCNGSAGSKGHMGEPSSATPYAISQPLRTLPDLSDQAVKDDQMAAGLPSHTPSSSLSSSSSFHNAKISPDVVVDLYEKYVIPLTKDVEVEYLLQRLDNAE